jgi:VanZ family protein
MFKKDKHFIPAYVFAGLIVIGSSISTRGLRKIRRIHELFHLIFSDYSMHFFGFAIFAILLAWGYYKNKTSLLLFRAGLIACMFGLVIEVYQKFLPYRDFSLIDLAFDWAGVLLALPVFWYVVIKKHLFGL